MTRPYPLQPRKQRILERMIYIYRAWRYVKIVEYDILNSEKHHNTRVTSHGCALQFIRLKTMFRRNYTEQEAVKAYAIATRGDYLKEDNNNEVSITYKGMLFTSLTGLLEEQAKSIMTLNTSVSVMIAVIALIVSIIALNH